ncbi:MAG TPA: hypothetical protein VGF03_13290 [Bryobacteraceae bacterium]
MRRSLEAGIASGVMLRRPAAHVCDWAARKRRAVFSRLLPQLVDNTYRGRKLALWLFAVVVAVKILQCVLTIFNGNYVLRGADGIPLDTYTSAGAQTVVAIWAVASLNRLLIGLLCVLVLVRYRSLIASMFALLAVQDLGRAVILHFIPIVRAGTPPASFANSMLFALTIVGLSLSVWEAKQP